ncbi:MAG: amino acid carrier protein, partial [Elusimicrobiota bacterium]|nr:amino acid carrier protein [Elusimicrobiota bacterium]
METISAISTYINEFVWGTWFIVLLLGIHIYMTFRTGFIQRKIFLGIKLSLQKEPDSKGDISHFGALTTALAATVGTGNIVGVGTALALGGPGAIFWMWITGIFGIATKYAESLVAVKYRLATKDGRILGGAMYVLERISLTVGLVDRDRKDGSNVLTKSKFALKWLGFLFAVFGSIAAFGIGSGVQSNAVATNLFASFNVEPWISGVLMAVLLAVVVIGGIKTISEVCMRFVPAMAILYCAGCIFILVLNVEYILPAISLIVESAFNPQAAGGGFVGATLMAAARFGIARSLFSNESGMGSAPLVSAAAKTRNPFRQALVSSTGTFWDTVVICAITGITLVSTIVAKPEIIPAGANGGILTELVFGQIAYVGPIVLTFGLITFAFSTILGWSYYGERCAEYLFGQNVKIPYRLLFVITTFVGATIPLNLVWQIADS